jgi:hypothetical protein
MGGTVRTIGQRGGMQTQPVGAPVALNPQQLPQPELPPAFWGDAQGQQFQGGYGDTSQLMPEPMPQPMQQAPLGQIRSSPMPQWGGGMMLGSPMGPMRQQMAQAPQAPQAQTSSAYSGGLGQLAGRQPWPPQGFTGLVR